MTDQEILMGLLGKVKPDIYLAAKERLKGMQGPEQGLVGESRSDRQQGRAEDAKPGERGVGEIVERELQQHIARRLEEERRRYRTAKTKGLIYRQHVAMGKCSALAEILKRLTASEAKRSDLANAEPSYGDGGKK